MGHLAPIVIENGGWALFITTARGRNHAKSMLDMAKTRKDWFSEVLPVNVTGCDVGGGRRAAAGRIYGHLRQGGGPTP